MNRILLATWLSLLASTHPVPARDSARQAQQVLQQTGVTGGLVVHVGCGDGKLTAALRASDSFIVQGLDADVTQARQNIQAAGVYGPASAVQWRGGALPYVDNLARLIVVSGDEGCVSKEEVLRVLCSGGVAELDVKSAPVLDGMAAAQNRLFISRVDGTLICLGDPGR